MRPPEESDTKAFKTFKGDEPGFVPVDIKSLPQLPDQAAHRYLFVAIDRATRGVYVEILGKKTAAQAAGLLQRLVDQAPFKVQKVLTDNGKAFTDRCCATGERDATGRHRCDRTCDQHGIEHRLIKPRHPQTNGRVERCNGRISAVLATTRFDAAQSLVVRFIKILTCPAPYDYIPRRSYLSRPVRLYTFFLNSSGRFSCQSCRA